VVVLCKNQFYYFPALWPDSGHVAVDESDIFKILKGISKHAEQISPEEAARTALGVFTTLKRSEWAAARKDLCSLERNENALHIIDSALFVLVLDDYAPSDIHDVAANMLHGTNQLAEGGTLQVGTCLNRWYDKLQVRQIHWRCGKKQLLTTNNISHTFCDDLLYEPVDRLSRRNCGGQF
jgi:carnitine O-acetyltransferase